MDLLVFQKDRNVDKNASKLIWICRQNTERSGLSKTHTSNFLWILNLEINKIASTCTNYMILIKLEIQFFIEKTRVYRHVYNRIGCRNVDTRGRVTESSDLTRGSRNLALKEDSPMRATIHANYTKSFFFFRSSIKLKSNPALNVNIDDKAGHSLVLYPKWNNNFSTLQLWEKKIVPTFAPAALLLAARNSEVHTPVHALFCLTQS